MSSQLEITSRESDGILVLDLKGRLVAGESSNMIRETIQHAAAAGQTHIVLNLSEVDFIDSTGLGSLVVCYTTLRKGGGALKLVNPQRHSIELLVLTKLSTVFEVFQAEQDAVNSFFPERKIQRFDILQFVQQQKEEENG